MDSKNKFKVSKPYEGKLVSSLLYSPDVRGGDNL
jgi:hypothetical protein